MGIMWAHFAHTASYSLSLLPFVLPLSPRTGLDLSPVIPFLFPLPQGVVHQDNRHVSRGAREHRVSWL